MEGISVGVQIRLLSDIAGGFIKRGEVGRVVGFDTRGNIKVEWDNGLMLGVIPGNDAFCCV